MDLPITPQRLNYLEEAQQWMKTIDAARALGLSTQTIHRYRDDKGGFLAVGYDYQFGMHPNSPIRWNVPAIRKALHKAEAMDSKEGNAPLTLLGGTIMSCGNPLNH